MDLKDIIKSRRIEYQYTMKDLAEKIGVSEGTISRWESGDIANMKRDKISALSRILDISLETLMGWENPPTTPAANLFPFEAGKYKIPIVATVAAGSPIFAEDNIEGYIDYDKDPGGHVFACKIKGDSMSPRILDGDIIIVDQEVQWENNDIVVVTVNGDSATCKRIRKYADGIQLVSINPAYEPMTFTQDEVEKLPVNIVGRVMQSRSNY